MSQANNMSQAHIKIVQKRIDIIQGQIDRLIASGDKMNLLGTVTAKEQISAWKKIIKKAERRILKLKG